MITIKEYTEQLETENRTLYEDKNYWKRLVEKRKFQLQQKENIIKEIERLNNIVNQVEKLAESEYEKYKDKSDVSLNCVALANLKILNKLKELKGSDKE